MNDLLHRMTPVQSADRTGRSRALALCAAAALLSTPLFAQIHIIPSTQSSGRWHDAYLNKKILLKSVQMIFSSLAGKYVI